MDLLCIDFMNSRWYKSHDMHCEPFSDPDWAAAFFRRWGFSIASGLSDAQLAELLELRDRLLEAVDELEARQSLSAEKIRALNRYLEHTSFHYQLECGAGKFTAALQPLRHDWNHVLSQICISFVQFIVMCRVERIKRCKNQECKWVFYDESKNNSRKWCCNTCASLIKVRQFRKKQQ